jgi:hypothetical protein
MDDLRARRLALNEAIARDVNDAVAEVAAHWHRPDEPIELICECSHVTCAERVTLTFDEYRAVRQNDARFVVVDDHVVDEIEQRVGRVGTATIVEKTGPARDAVEARPRRPAGSP